MSDYQLGKRVKCEFCGGTGGEIDENPIFGWRLANNCVDLFIAENGAQVAPVSFFNDMGKTFSPYYVSPWQKENIEIDEPVLVPLRGDFFCMPFGGNDDVYRGENHPVHGEAAGSVWMFRETKADNDQVTLSLELETEIVPGKITRELSLKEGQNVIYWCDTLEGYNVKMPLGHHSILKVPEDQAGLLMSVGKFELGMTCPGVFSNPVNQEYQSLAMGKEFTELSKVPLESSSNKFGDFSTFPTPQGYDDLLGVFKKETGSPSWTVGVYPHEGFLWFALKDAAVLPATVFWVSHKGRYASPWNGRNKCLGVEDVCAFFADGLRPSCEHNILNDKGFKTAIELTRNTPTEVKYIHGAVRIPEGFGRVADVQFKDGEVIFTDVHKNTVATEVDYAFLNPAFEK